MSTTEDFRMGLLVERHDAERDLDTEEDELVEDMWDAEDAAYQAADDAWADRGWSE